MKAGSALWRTCASSGVLSPRDSSLTAKRHTNEEELMSDRAFFDTNVFVYAIVQDDPRSDEALKN